MFWTSVKQTSANVIRIDGIVVFISGEFRKKLASLSRPFAASVDRGFQFNERSQLFIRTHHEALSVVAMCVCNPDCSSAGAHA